MTQVPTSLQICDMTTLGAAQPLWVLDGLTEHTTVRELICCRVYQEVQDYNTHKPEYFCGLVRPTEAEQTLNGYRLATPRQLDWEQQAELAIAAFLANGFLILVGDRQVTELDEEIAVSPEQTVTFLRLVPLVGG
ncbi:hypothetical protein [Halomicronema sp. CCY15110]|uniref:hypothetical protein n=1 Tax=Halomicronema sp. CCY15110 TaxID=2767773 RepID=UPI001EF31C16|nr:hypothetical protein [Halomicronema sp. CCY15110]